MIAILVRAGGVRLGMGMAPGRFVEALDIVERCF